MAQDPSTCEHLNWTVNSTVHRTALGTGQLGAVHLSVKLSCIDCETAFWFPGLGTGTSYVEPTTSTDGFTASLPAVQANRRNDPDPSLVSVAIRNGDILKGRRR